MYFSISLRSCASDVNAVLAVEEFELLQLFTQRRVAIAMYLAKHLYHLLGFGQPIHEVEVILGREVGVNRLITLLAILAKPPVEGGLGDLVLFEYLTELRTIRQIFGEDLRPLLVCSSLAHTFPFDCAIPRFSHLAEAA